MNYANYSKKARKWNSDKAVSLDHYCSHHGIQYYVITESPTQISFEDTQGMVFLNLPDRSCSLPLEAENDPILTIELLAYVLMRYDAREIMSRQHLTIPENLRKRIDE
jgi:hypothetical protein